MDPIHQQEDGKWYFYDETWADTLGPYDTKEECEAALHKYAETL